MASKLGPQEFKLTAQLAIKIGGYQLYVGAVVARPGAVTFGVRKGSFVVEHCIEGRAFWGWIVLAGVVIAAIVGRIAGQG
jgi:hypothetical protein